MTGARRQPVTQKFTLRGLRRWAFAKPLPRGFVNRENGWAEGDNTSIEAQTWVALR